MRIPSLSAVLGIAGWTSYASAVVKMSISRGPDPFANTNHITSRSTITSDLHNNLTRGSYFVDVEVGTPPQAQRLVIDTGSTDVWLLSDNTDLCTSRTLQRKYFGGCISSFSTSKSSTFKTVGKGQFNITYLDGSGATGDYILDTFSISGSSLTNLQMGMALKATLGTGLMGLGYSINEASNSRKNIVPAFTYPSVIETMVSQGKIARKAYSLYLDDLQSSTGSIIFGGLDTDKFHGTLLQLPVIPSTFPNGTKVYAELAVVMSSFGITGQQGNTVNLTADGTKEPVLLDSGTTFSYFPNDLAKAIYKSIGAIDDTRRSGLVLIDCIVLSTSPALTFNFGFGTAANGVQIKIPIHELVFSLSSLFNATEDQLPSSPFSSTCGFGIFPGNDIALTILGDSFLRSAYVVYDLEANQIAIAQTNFNSSTSSIVEFSATATRIPNVSGVASSVDITRTASAVFPGIGGIATGTVTISPSGAGATVTVSSSPSASKAEAARSVPVFDISHIVVLGVSSIFAFMGCGVLLL